MLKLTITPEGKETQTLEFTPEQLRLALIELDGYGEDCSDDMKAIRTALHTVATAAPLVEKLDALVVLGLPVRTRVEGLRKLAAMPPIGTNILLKAIEVLEERNPKKRYWPLMDLLMHERAIAEQCFPDVESTVPEHMQAPPSWLLETPITEAKPA